MCKTCMFVISASLDEYINASRSQRLSSRSRRETDRKANWNIVTGINGRTRFSLAVSGLQVHRRRVTWIQKEDEVVIGQGTFFSTLSSRTSYISPQMIFYHNRPASHYSLHFLSVFTVIQKSHTKIPRHYIQ